MKVSVLSSSADFLHDLDKRHKIHFLRFHGLLKAVNLNLLIKIVGSSAPQKNATPFSAN